MSSQHYQELVKQNFASKEQLTAEIINLGAIAKLPKGTEFYLSDIHGEANGLRHLLNIASGILEVKLQDCFQESLSASEICDLSKLISYPMEMLALKKETGVDLSPWRQEQTQHLFGFMSFCASKYSRSKVRKRFPEKYAYIFDELLACMPFTTNKEAYFNSIVEDIVALGLFEDFVDATTRTIKLLLIDHLHIVGDIFDRGEQAYEVMNQLMAYPSIDFQWGNHDVLWFGAFCGSMACLTTLLRIAVKYGYLDAIESDYHINLWRLYEYADQHYPAEAAFSPNKKLPNADRHAKIHQALLALQMKVEYQLIQRNPDFEMNDRLFLEGQETVPLTAAGEVFLRQVSPALTEEETDLLQHLVHEFQHSANLQKQLYFMMENGSMYLIYNNVLLYHSCIPLDEKGQFAPFFGYRGQGLLDFSIR